MRRETLVRLDTNVDDLDPRLLPHVIDRLLEAGALDAWITPIVMKKGRPAFTVSALGAPDRADDVRRAMFAETSTIGIRESEVVRHALDRRTEHVDVGGHLVGVKIATDGDQVVNVSVEWDDVVAAAAAAGRPAVDVLADAEAAARRFT